MTAASEGTGSSDLPRTRGAWIVRAAVAALVALALLRLLQAADLPDRGYFTKYPEAARALLAGELEPERLGEVSPGYLVVLAAFRAATASPDVELLVALQIAALGLAALLAGLTAARCAGAVAGVAAAGAVLASRMAFVNATELEPETLVLLLDALALWLLARERPRALAGGLVVGAAITVRPTALVAAAAAAWWFAWTRRAADGRRRAWWALRFGAGLAAPVLVMAVAIRLATGASSVMDPGYVLYEGLNPRATGLSGVDPAVVSALEDSLGYPDALHGAYRTVAERALGAVADPGSANRYWRERALRWSRSDPRGAFRLTLEKLHGALSDYRAWDLVTLERRDRLLPRGLWLPFGLLAAAGLAGGIAHRRDPLLRLVVLLALARLVPPVLFYASARQRNPLVVPLAILAGAGLAAAVAAWRQGRRRRVLAAAGAVVAVGLLLGLPSPVQREDRHAWNLSLRSAGVRRALARDPGGAAAVEAALLGIAGADAEPGAVLAAVRRRLAAAPPAAERFDLALAAARAGDPETAERVLGVLAAEGYRPRRGWTVPPSVAYQRARVRLALGDRRAAARLADDAMDEAPGDPDVLALAAVLARESGRPGVAAAREERLHELHDPFTAARALALAHVAAGHHPAARPYVERLIEGVPEWSLAR